MADLAFEMPIFSRFPGDRIFPLIPRELLEADGGADYVLTQRLSRRIVVDSGAS
jgi:hypothetical protein